MYCEDYAEYFTVILSFLAFHFCFAYFIYLVSCNQPCTIVSASTTHQTCINNTCTIPCANHVHQPSTPIPNHVPTMPISPRCASRTMPTSSVQHAPQSCVKPRAKLCLQNYYTNIKNTCIQSCISIMLYTITLSTCNPQNMHINIHVNI